MDSIGIYLLSDDDDEIHSNSNAIRYRQLRDKSNIFTLPNQTFLNLFHLSKPAVQYLLEQLETTLPIRTSSSSIPIILKVAAMLRFCAQGSFQTSVGQDFLVGMSQSTVSKMINEVVSAMEENVCQKWISFRQSDRDKELAAEFFYNSTGFPGVIGCVDGTHINIIRPNENEHLFLNRKGKHSINTMIACDHKMWILTVDPRNGGATRDSFIWALISYRQHLQQSYNSNSSNYWLLSDSGYPLEPWLITPFRAAPEGSREASFNIRHSKTRNIIERCIELLKSRFRCLLEARELHYSPHKASQIINVCSTLHNICIHFNVPLNFEDQTMPDQPVFQGKTASNEPENTIATRIRQNILNSIV